MVLPRQKIYYGSWEEISFFKNLEMECNKKASIFLVLASGHTKIADVKRLWVKGISILVHSYPKIYPVC